MLSNFIVDQKELFSMRLCTILKSKKRTDPNNKDGIVNLAIVIIFYL